MSYLTIEIKDRRSKIVYEGNVAELAESIAKLTLIDKQFEQALNEAIANVIDELEARIIRDKLIGFINNSEI